MHAQNTIGRRKLQDGGTTWAIQVSPIQCVRYEEGRTMKRNKNSVISTWVVSRWKVYVDYTRLNKVVYKDHFLVRKSHYCFLDGYSRYNQIIMCLEDQEKTTFTYSFSMFAFRWMPVGLCNVPTTFRR